jgi:hypothetical protein
MDILNSIVTALLTSAVVSSAISFLLKTWLEVRLKHQFELELEKQRHSYEIELERIKNELTNSPNADSPLIRKSWSWFIESETWQERLPMSRIQALFCLTS